jgi:hypothetical protein
MFSLFEVKHKIVIFTQSPISKAPRVVKEANCLARNGYKITVFSLWYDSTMVKNEVELLDEGIIYKAGIDITNKNIKSAFHRVKRRLYRESTKILGTQSKHALGYGYKEFLKKLKEEKADLYIGHEEMSLALAKDLIEEGFKVGFDFEDFHSQDLLSKDRVYRPVKLLSSLENFILHNASYCVTTSDSLANQLAKEFNTNPPETVYNSFHRYNTDEPRIISSHSNSLVWISQVIGHGRGLELLIEGISLSKLSYELTLIGKKDLEFCDLISKSSPINLKLLFSDYIPSNRIASELEKFDVGIAFEEKNPKSRDLTITNKVFHYLNSGLAILATNTSGQFEMAQKTKSVISLVLPDTFQICENLEELFADREKLEMRKKQSRFYGNEVFCFENEELKILKLVWDVLA